MLLNYILLIAFAIVQGKVKVNELVGEFGSYLKNVAPDEKYFIPKGQCNKNFTLKEVGCYYPNLTPKFHRPLGLKVVVIDKKKATIKVAEDLSYVTIKRRRCKDTAIIEITKLCRLPNNYLPVNQTDDELCNKSDNQSVNHSFNQSVNQPGDYMRTSDVSKFNDTKSGNSSNTEVGELVLNDEGDDNAYNDPIEVDDPLDYSRLWFSPVNWVRHQPPSEDLKKLNLPLRKATDYDYFHQVASEEELKNSKETVISNGDDKRFYKSFV